MHIHSKTRLIKRSYSKSLAPHLVSLMMFGFLSFNCMGQNDSLFGLANRYYQHNEFSLAIKAYLQIIEKGNQTPEVLYNLGNAYFKNGNLGFAILYFEKAKMLSPHDDDINQNLAIANARVVDKIDVIPDFFIKRWARHLVSLLQSNTWAIISMISFVVMLALFLMFFFSGTMFVKRIGLYSAVGLLFVSILTYWCSVERKKFITDNHTAIIIEPSATIKSSPDTDGNNVFVLHEGTKVMLIDSIENWKEIKLTDGNKGWLESKSIRAI